MIMNINEYLQLEEVPDPEDFRIFSSQELDLFAEKIGIVIDSWKITSYYLPFFENVMTRSITINNQYNAVMINDLIIWWEI